jgi:hypothetical protein
MATEVVVFSGTRKEQRTYTNTAASDEDAVLIDISTLTGPNGSAPSKLAIEKIEYDVGQDTVIDFDATTDTPIAVLTQGSGCIDFWQNGKGARLVDPQASGATGDVKILTNAGVGANEYTLHITFVKKD